MTFNTQTFTNNIDIDKFFNRFGYYGFFEWFNINISSNPIWGSPLGNKENWEIIWGNLPILFGRSSINLVEFLCINSIIITETRGKFIPLNEISSNLGNPGVSYQFNAIPNIKSSYNTLNSNLPAFVNFNDPIYIQTHGVKPLSSILKNTTDNRWNNANFPIGFSSLSVSDETSVSGKSNGFLIEADFFKFRGRGFVQTLGRANYKPLITYVINYNGNDSKILSVKKEWIIFNGNLNNIASASTNDQWDTLFNQPNFIIANYAFSLHNSTNGNYNTINPSQSTVNLYKNIRNVALSISNSSSYAITFLQNVLIQLDLINSYPGTPTTSASVIPVNFTQSVLTPGRLAMTGQDPTSQVGSGVSITGPLPIITNLFQPTGKPGPIVFNIGGATAS